MSSTGFSPNFTKHRRPLYELVLNMSGGPICVAALLVGSTLSKSHNIKDGIASIAVSGMLLCIYGGLVGLAGYKTGLSTGGLLERAFGKGGSPVVILVIAISLTGWYAVQTSLFGNVIHALLPKAGVLTQPNVASAWGGILMLSTALFGYRGLSFLSLFSVPLLLLLTTTGLIQALLSATATDLLQNSSRPIADAITFIFGGLAVGATCISDFTRYARRPLHVWISVVISFLIVNSYMIASGFATSAASGKGDLLFSMMSLGLGIPALLILVLGQWTTNDDNLYSSSLAIASAVPSLKKYLIVISLGLSATFFAVIGFSDYFTSYLTALGIGIPPLGGIVIVNEMLVYNNTTGMRFVRLNAFLAWGAGVWAGIFVKAGIPTLNSIVVAAIAYYLATRIEGSRKSGI